MTRVATVTLLWTIDKPPRVIGSDTTMVDVSAAGEARIEAATAQAEASELGVAEINAAAQTEAIAAAEARVEAAEQIAADITQAALNTALGQELSAHRTRCEQWQTQHDQTHMTLTAEIAGLKTEMGALTAAMTEMAARPGPTVRTVSASSNPDGSGDLTATTVEPGGVEGNPEATEGSGVAPVARKKMRLI